MSVRSDKNARTLKCQLIAIWGCMLMAYSLAYFFLADLEGNIYVNAIILGSAEMLSNAASGYLLLKVREDIAFRICCGLALVSNFVLPYLTDPLISGLVLFLTIGGLGGMYNCMYLVVEMQVSPVEIGTIFQLLVVSGAIMTSTVSLLATLPQPIPNLLTASLCVAAFVISLQLPEGGKNLPKSVEINRSVVAVDQDYVQGDAVTFTSSFHQPTHSLTYREIVGNVSRPRINESCLDPDLLDADGNKASNILKLWKSDANLLDQE